MRKSPEKCVPIIFRTRDNLPGGMVCSTKGNICNAKSLMTYARSRLSLGTEAKSNNVGKNG